MKTVAIILPTMGRPSMLRESLDSLVIQNSEALHVNVYLLNNGGGEATKQVYFDYRDKLCLRYKETQVNDCSLIGGLHIDAIETDKCDYLVEWTDDDRMYPGNLLLKTTMLDLDDKYAFVCSPAKCIDESGAPIPGKQKGLMPQQEISFADLFTTCKIIMGGVVWKAKCFPHNISYPVRIGGEWVRYMHALAAGFNGFYIPLELTELRLWSGSDSEMNGFAQDEFLQMHMGCWKYFMDTYHYQPSEPEWDTMTTIYTQLRLFQGRREMTELRSQYANI